MVQMVQILDTVARRDLPDAANTTMNATGEQFGAGVGRALAGAGDALQQQALLLKQDYKQRENYNLEAEYAKFTSETSMGVDEATRNAQGTDGSGFHAGVLGSFDKRAADFLSKVPEGEREKWNARIAQTRGALAPRIAQSEFRIRDDYQKTGISTQLDTAMVEVDQNPGVAAQKKAGIEKLIDASNLPADVKQAQKDSARTALEAARLRATIRTNPDQVAADLGGTTSYDRKVRQRESSGDDNAQATTSSAGGRYQYIESTWNAIANSPEGRAAGIQPEKKGEFVQRRDPAQQEAAHAISKKQNRAALVDAGFEANERNMYLAHFMGAGGAVDFLQQLAKNPGRTAADAFPAQARANTKLFYGSSGRSGDPESRGALTVAQAYNKITAGFSGAPVAEGDPQRVEDLGYAERLRLRSEAERASIAQSQAAAAREQAAYADQFNKLSLDLQDGRVGRAGVDAAREAGWLTDASDIKKLYSLADSKEQQTTDVDAYNSAIQNPDTVWNPNDPNQRKMVNAGVTANGNSSDYAYQAWQRTGILADSAAVGLRGDIGSGDPSRIARALNILGNMVIDPARPQPFAGVKNGEELERAGVYFNHRLDLGETDKEAIARRWAEINSPEYQRTVKVRDEERKQFLDEMRKKDPTSDILKAFDQNGLWPGGKPSMDPSLKAGMIGDYAEIALEHFNQFGDKKAAEAWATSQVQKMWGASNGRVVRFPPDRVYPPSSEGTKDYIYRQAAEGIKAATGKDVDPKDIMLLPLPRITSELWRAGRPAPYGLVYMTKDENGSPVMHSLYAPNSLRMKPFVADPAAEERRLSAEREAALRAARTPAPPPELPPAPSSRRCSSSSCR